VRGKLADGLLQALRAHLRGAYRNIARSSPLTTCGADVTTDRVPLFGQVDAENLERFNRVQQLVVDQNRRAADRHAWWARAARR
jgi:hypothetical protein